MGDQDAKRSKPVGDGGNLWKACKSDPNSLLAPNADVVTERNPSLHTPMHCCASMDRLDAVCVRQVLEFCFVSPSRLHNGIACCSRRLNIYCNLWKACKSDPSSLQPPNADVVTERNPSLYTPMHCCASMDRLDAACVRHVLEFCFTSPSALHNGIACCSRRLNICWRNHHRRIVLIFTAVVIEALDRLEPMIGVAVGNLEDIL